MDGYAGGMEDSMYGPDVENAEVEAGRPAPETDRMLAAKIARKIKIDKRHHEKAFKRMRRDMHVATWGADKDWPAGNYRANIAGRHVKMKKAALYAKNPRAAATRKEKLDFAVWDENPASLQLAMQTIQAAQAVAQQPLQPGMPPELPPGFEQAQAVLADFQQGMAKREIYDKIGKTLEVVFSYFLGEQKPLDFKRGMKHTVGRALTCGVAYVELDFQREYGPRPGLEASLADSRTRLDHLRTLQEQMMEAEIAEMEAEIAELEYAMQAMMDEPEIVLREGLAIDFPLATRVIPDRRCKSLDGFIGARHLSIEYMYTVQEVQEKFGVELNKNFTSYSQNDGSSREIASNNIMDDDYEWSEGEETEGDKKDGMVCVWKHYDKAAGLCYWLADGYPGFLAEPAAPSVYVEDFWPVFALTFNAVENEDELFPPSDVCLLMDMQREHNRSRQGMREHRRAARPRYVAARGAFGDEDGPEALRDLEAFEMALLNMDPTVRINDILQTVPVPGVDMNLYATEPFFTDTQIVVGAQEAQFGGIARATATESAIAANATTSADASSIDDLDSFLTVIARASSQILMREMSEQQVTHIAGAGAVWPEATVREVADELWLEVEAGSTGKPNQAVEINNWKQMLPLLIQMGNINPTWLVKETLRRLDDRMDLTEAIAAGIPSIVAQNQMAGGAAATSNQPSPEDPGDNPASQGAQGANNAPQPPRGEGGSGPAFGSNQVDSAL